MRYVRSATGIGLKITIKFLRGAARFGLGSTTTTCDAQQTAPRATAGCNDQVPAALSSGAAGNGLGTTIKYLRRTTSGAAGNGRTQRPSTCGTIERRR
jgi:hypothetical protein